MFLLFGSCLWVFDLRKHGCISVFRMRFSLLSLAWAFQAAATILENGQERLNPYPGQAEQVSVDDSWKSYGADASEISYKGRWDSTYTSCE